MPDNHFPTTETPAPPGWITFDMANLPADILAGGVLTLTNLATDAQQTFPIATVMSPCLSLEAGLYRLALNAVGREPYRSLVEVTAGHPVQVRPTLPSLGQQPPASLADMLARLRVPDPTINPRDLTVPEGKTIELNFELEVYRPDWQQISLTDVDTAKQIIGVGGAVWGIDAPRFGPIRPEHEVASPVTIEQLAKEYIYGNSSAVSNWKDEINGRLFKEPWSFSIFTYGTVTINRGGVLRLTDKSSFFACWKLRQHVTSTLEVRGHGPGVIWPASFESFC